MRVKDLFRFSFEKLFRRSLSISGGARLTKVNHLSQVNRLYANLEIVTLKYLITKHKIDCVIDVGANKGQYYRLMRKIIGYNGMIISIEPSWIEYTHLTEASKNDPNHMALNVACGDKPGKALLNVYQDSKLNSLYNSSGYSRKRFGHNIDHVQGAEVDVETLESILSARSIPASASLFVKVDTQGHDIPVLKGLGSRLGCVLAIQSELSLIKVYEGTPSYLEALKYLESIGFNLFSTSPVTRDRNDNSIIEMNGFFVRRG